MNFDIICLIPSAHQGLTCLRPLCPVSRCRPEFGLRHTHNMDQAQLDPAMPDHFLAAPVRCATMGALI